MMTWYFVIMKNLFEIAQKLHLVKLHFTWSVMPNYIQFSISFPLKTLDTNFCKDVRRFSFWTNNMLRNNISSKKHSSLGSKPEFADILLKINKLKKPNFRLTFSTRNNQNTSLNKYKISSVISMLKQSNIQFSQNSVLQAKS